MSVNERKICLEVYPLFIDSDMTEDRLAEFSFELRQEFADKKKSFEN